MNTPLHERQSYSRFSRIWQAAWDRQDFDFCNRCRNAYEDAWARQAAMAAKAKRRMAA